MMTPINQIPQASESQKERFDLKQPMFYERMGEDFDAGDQSFPNEIIYRILSFLPPEQLREAGLVCKLWHQCASSDFVWRSYRLKALFPSEPIIDRSVWKACVDIKRHGLEFEQKGRPGVESKRHYFELLQMASEVENGHGISILTLPKGLSLNKIVAFALAPKEGGNATQIDVHTQKIIELHGDIELKETVTAAVTNGVFKNSRDKYVSKQIELIKGLNCEMPQVVAVMALAILRFISSDPNNRLRIFGDDPLTYTLCMEKVKGSHVAFGGFTTGGPYVADDVNIPRGIDGVGGQRKFAVIL